jgi:hypothetical protein
VTTPGEPSTPAIPSAAWAPPAPAPSAPWSSPGAVGPAQRQHTNGFAVTALVLGLTAFCTMVTGILAVIFGNIALGKIAMSEGRDKGRGMAIAGIVLGWVSIAIIGVLAIIWFAYNLSNG